MLWTWDEAKNRRNRQKHKLSFETAGRVFDDPLAVSRPDSHSGEERFQTVGAIDGVIVLVIHTHLFTDPGSDEEVGRIISARKATKNERRAYEEGSF